jgi:hypothetical protein
LWATKDDGAEEAAGGFAVAGDCCAPARVKAIDPKARYKVKRIKIFKIIKLTDIIAKFYQYESAFPDICLSLQSPGSRLTMAGSMGPHGPVW